MPHCIVGRPINSRQEQQLCCPPTPPASLVMFPHQPFIRPNTLQRCPHSCLAITRLSTCPSVRLIWSFRFDFAGIFQLFTQLSPPIAIRVSQARHFTGASDWEITSAHKSYSRCLLGAVSAGLSDFVILESKDFLVQPGLRTMADSSTKTIEKKLK